MDEKYIKGIIGAVCLLLGFGGNMALTDTQMDNAYICPLNNQVGVFDRVSASMKTGYYLDNTGIEKRVACREGRTYAAWIPLTTYAESKGVTFNIPDVEEHAGNGIYTEKCNPSGCEAQ